MRDNNTKFLVKFLGATMEAMNLKPESFVKIFWNLALIAIALMATRTLLNIISFYVGLPQWWKKLSKNKELRTWTFIVIIGIWGTNLITHAAPILEQVVKILEIMIKPSL